MHRHRSPNRHPLDALRLPFMSWFVIYRSINYKNLCWWLNLSNSVTWVHITMSAPGNLRGVLTLTLTRVGWSTCHPYPLFSSHSLFSLALHLIIYDGCFLAVDNGQGLGLVQVVANDFTPLGPHVIQAATRSMLVGLMGRYIYVCFNKSCNVNAHHIYISSDYSK